MDKSAKYKVMAFRAKEVQNSWNPTIGDWWNCSCESCLKSERLWIIDNVALLSIDETYERKGEASIDKAYRILLSWERDGGFAPFWRAAKENREKYGPDFAKNGYVWLPKQDQLLEMVYNPENISVACPDVIICDIKDFSEKDCDYGFETLEQIYLGYVMKVLYNKEWDSKEEKWKTIMCKSHPDEPVYLNENYCQKCR